MLKFLVFYIERLEGSISTAFNLFSDKNILLKHSWNKFTPTKYELDWNNTLKVLRIHRLENNTIS